MKDDYDVLGPEATIQTTINNGTGESRVRSDAVFVLCHDYLDLIKHEHVICTSTVSKQLDFTGLGLFQIWIYRIFYFIKHIHLPFL